MADAYITTSEAAERLRMSEETIRRWCRTGRLPSVQIGRIHRIPLQALLDLIAVQLPSTQVEEPQPSLEAARPDLPTQAGATKDEDQLPPGWVRTHTYPTAPHRRRPTIVGQDW